MALLAGLAASASAIDKNWTCNVGSAWSTAGCWSPVGQPAATDIARIGNVAGVQNSTSRLDSNRVVAGLHVNDGMTMDTDGFTLDVNGDTSLSGLNSVGVNDFPTRLRIDQAIDGADFFTHDLSVSNQAEVRLNGGGISATGVFSIGGGSSLHGNGTVRLSGNGTTFINDGTIFPQPSSITFSQTGSGRYDLDGTGGNGYIDFAVSGAALTFQGDGISDAFGGFVSMLSSCTLNMDLDDAWAADSTSLFNIYGAGIGGDSRIIGSPLAFSGTFNIFGGANLDLEADTTFNNSAQMILGNLASATVSGDATVNGGLFQLNDSTLDFDGAVELSGGTFVTPSETAADGVVNFNGPTEWAGTVNINGIARQFGVATVSAATVINADTFDMDGTSTTEWNINHNLVVNAHRIDFNSSDFSVTMTVGGGLFGRITVNLEQPGEAWTVSGTLNLEGNSLLFNTRIGNGSPLVLSGDVNVNGKNDIATPTTIPSTAVIDIADATDALRFMSYSLIGANVTFTGTGILQNASNGDMTLNSGLNTNGVGLNNTGTLRIGASAGIASVDRFQTSGNWAVQIGGPSAGTQHDRLVSNGPASLGGVLTVDLIGGYQPVVGDEFTILNAVGGVSGAFGPGVTSTAGSTTYHWDVIVSAADVTLRLASIDAPCRADFNADGLVNSQDFFDFLTPFFAAAPAADFNADGAVNSQDFFDFLTAFFSGC